MARKARAAYQDFLTLWKDADPDIPILKQAKAEYAKPLSCSRSVQNRTLEQSRLSVNTWRPRETSLPEADFWPGTVSECAATEGEAAIAIATSLHR